MFRFSEMVGCYGLVVTNELLDFIERSFVAKAAETDRDVVRRAAHAEAYGATLELGADGSIVSRAGAEELFRSQVLVIAPTCERLVRPPT